MTAAPAATGRQAAWRRVAILPYAWHIALIVAAGAIVRLAFLPRQPLWRDEAFTAIAVGKPVGDMLAAVSRDSAPPLYYLLDHIVAQLGTAPWTLRLVSAFAGIALIAIVAALGRRIGGDRAGLGAAALVAFAPATVIASQDARMYALGAALSALALLLLWRAIEDPSPLGWAVYGASAAAAAWTEYFDALALVAALAAAIIVLRPPRRAAALAVAVTAAAGASLVPWLVAAQAQFQHAQVPFWVQPIGPVTAFGTAAQFVTGPPVDPEVPFRPLLVGLQAAAVIIGVVGLAVLAVRRDELSRAGRSAAGLCALASMLGVAFLVGASLWRPLLEARYASVLWPSLYAVAGAGVALARPRLGAGLLACLLAAAVGLSAAVSHPDTAQVVPTIAGRLGPNDVVLTYPTQYLLVLHDATPGIRARLHVLGTDIPWYWGTAVYPAGAVVPDVPSDVPASRGTVFWVVEPEDPEPVLPAGYREVGRTCAVRVCLQEYAAP